MKGLSRSEYLVTPAWLKQHLEDENLRIIEVTGILQRGSGEVQGVKRNIAKKIAYDKRHIPGAIFLDVASFDGPFADKDSDLPMTWPAKQQFEQLMGKIGVSNDSHVVLYASTVAQSMYSCIMWCTRAWWIMHHFGVNCSIMNGALEQWIAEGYPVTDIVSEYMPTNFHASDNWQQGIAYKDDVKKSLKNNKKDKVINALPKGFYLGTEEIQYGPRKGHITGSISVPMTELVDWDSGKFISESAMQQYFSANDAIAEGEAIIYCGGGGCATTDAFALKLLGYNNVRIYDNSLFEWGADPELPMTDPSSA